jgi:hypothetical protein
MSSISKQCNLKNKKKIEKKIKKGPFQGHQILYEESLPIITANNYLIFSRALILNDEKIFYSPTFWENKKRMKKKNEIVAYSILLVLLTMRPATKTPGVDSKSSAHFPVKI